MTSLLLGITAIVAPARAEVQTVRIGETYGLTHLPIYVMVEQHLIEHEAASRGLGPVKVDLQQAGNGNVVSGLLLAGRIDVAMSGVVPFLSLWNKMPASQGIRGIAALSSSHVFLMTVDPRIKTIADYGAQDRIAMTDVKTTSYAVLLQMAAAKQFGWTERDRFDPISVPMAASEATATMMSGGTEVRSNMTDLPYSATERKLPAIRTILSSKDILGGPFTPTMAFTTQKFHDANPKMYAAIAAAFEKAADFSNDNPAKAAEIYLKYEPQKNTPATIVSMIGPSQPDELVFTTTPHGIAAFADFMHRSGQTKNTAPSWKNFFFENMADKQGS